MRVFKQVRNLLAAVGSDDEDEDFGALFSQLARLILKAHVFKAKLETCKNFYCLQYARPVFQSSG